MIDLSATYSTAAANSLEGENGLTGWIPETVRFFKENATDLVEIARARHS